MGSLLIWSSEVIIKEYVMLELSSGPLHDVRAESVEARDSYRTLGALTDSGIGM